MVDTPVHEYLGQDNSYRIEDSDSRFLQENDLISILIVQLPDIVLFPGETIPLRSLPSFAFAEIEQLIEQNKSIFGVMLYDPIEPLKIGTIVQVRHRFNDELSASIVGEGRHRFQLVQPISASVATQVRILPEFGSMRIPNAVKWNCAYWTMKEYNIYDGQRLVRAIQSHLWANSTTRRRQEDVVLFSYWVAMNLPLSNTQRQELLQLNSSIQRLQRILPLLETRYNMMCCTRCRISIAQRQDIFSFAQQRVGTFVNPNGFVHQMLNVTRVFAMNVDIPPEDPCLEDSWFPGYGWSLLYCMQCRQHLGWKFEWMNEDPSPQNITLFYGIRRASIQARLEEFTMSELH